MTDLILVADATGKQVLFSVPCSQSFEGSQLLIELSQLEIPQPVGFFDWIRYIDGTIDVLKGCFRIGAFIYPPGAVVFQCLVGAGSALQAGMKFVKNDTDPVDDKLKELSKTIHDVEKQLHANFDDLKAFITETEFTGDIIGETSSLMRHLRSCLKRMDQRSRENFRAAYEKKTPLSLAYSMISLLELSSTNPLVMSMAQEKAKTKATFKKWEDIILGVLGELMTIEAFASGLLKKENQYDFNRIMEKTQEVSEYIEKWRFEIGKDQGYWQHLKEDLKGFLEKNSNLSLAERADAIKGELEKYLTNDAFYISVHYAWDHENWGWMNTKAGEDQFIHLNGYGPHNLNTFVYRSKLANTVEIEKLEEMRIKVQAFKTEAFKDKMPQALLDDPIPNAGFTILYGKLMEEIRSANCPRREFGPGWWTYNFDFGGPDKRRLFVGYL
uniref:CHAT domain-containing protein n=1 Tax=Caenorhabditis tropicalis TaxID=1561998 RepID=A0A1I7TVT4_9PELO